MTDRFASLMTPLGLVIALGSALPVAAQTIPRAGAGSECATRCVAVEKLGVAWYAVARDAAGEIFKIIPIDLPADARSASGDAASSDTVRTQQSFEFSPNSGDTLGVRNQTYTTAAEVIVVTTYTYLGADGNMADAKVSVHRFRKQQPGPKDP